MKRFENFVKVSPTDFYAKFNYANAHLQIRLCLNCCVAVCCINKTNKVFDKHLRLYFRS